MHVCLLSPSRTVTVNPGFILESPEEFWKHTYVWVPFRMSYVNDLWWSPGIDVKVPRNYSPQSRDSTLHKQCLYLPQHLLPESTGQGSLLRVFSKCQAFSLAKVVVVDCWSFSSSVDCLIPGLGKWESHFSANLPGPEIISVESLRWGICQMLYKLANV